MVNAAETPEMPDCRIGEWLFSPSANEVSKGEIRRKLEHRAARTLELLCRRRGAIVSHEEILREIWNGRAISPNSVPVVISDLRQALGDDARDPRHIETVAKRGYRLLLGPEEDCPPAVAMPPADRPFQIVMVAAPLLLLFVVLFAWWTVRTEAPEEVSLIVTKVENATGSASYQPLADATSEVIAANAQRIEGVRVFRDNASPGDGAVKLDARLIIWSGRPTVMMSASDASDAVIWTGMTSGKEDLIPSEVASAMKQLSVMLGKGEP
jgi:DNA-binding winged helix-turn-helix (wHTH) protein